MATFRFLFFSSKHSSRRPLSLLQRFDLSKRTMSCSFTTRQNHGKPVHGYKKPGERKASRSWCNYIIPGAFLGFAGRAALFYYNDERRAVPKEQGKNCDCNTGTSPIIGGPFTLVNTENHLVTEKNFLGNWVLLYFGYTQSPDIVPKQVQIIAKAIDTLESKQNLKILPVFVTIDPQRDKPAHLRAYLKEFNSRIVGLTGPVGDIRQMAQEYRVYFKKVEEQGDDYLVESSHYIYLMNLSMEVVKCFGIEYTAEDLAEEISKEMKKSST